MYQKVPKKTSAECSIRQELLTVVQKEYIVEG